jgi:hypothetical protein
MPQHSRAGFAQISQATAEAASEGGGLLGFGGVQVSEGEKATLAEISTALGVERSGEPEAATRVRIITITDPRNGFLRPKFRNFPHLPRGPCVQSERVPTPFPTRG